MIGADMSVMFKKLPINGNTGARNGVRYHSRYA
jgi:hypothetical protein